MKPILFVLSLAFVGACYSEEPGVAVGYSAGYGYAGPQLEYVAPGVQVIADYDYPVFYSDGYYWRNDGGIWYRSGFYNRGWAVSYNVPYGVRGIREPGAYAHYRGGGYAGPAYRGGVYNNGAAVRDHRAYSAPAPAYRPASRGPVVRDHRR